MVKSYQIAIVLFGLLAMGNVSDKEALNKSIQDLSEHAKQKM